MVMESRYPTCAIRASGLLKPISKDTFLNLILSRSHSVCVGILKTENWKPASKISGGK